MKLTKDNIAKINVSDEVKKSLILDLTDIDEINTISGKDFYINWQDYHDEYSPERTDPCPDYYGYFSIRELGSPFDNIGEPCANEEELQDIILTVYDTCIAIFLNDYCEVGDGWKSLVKEARDIVRKWNIEHPEDGPIYFRQIKEKFGSLCLCLNGAPKEIWNKMKEIEKRSLSICERCGKEGKQVKHHGWIHTLCDECFEELKKE